MEKTGQNKLMSAHMISINRAQTFFNRKKITVGNRASC